MVLFHSLKFEEAKNMPLYGVLGQEQYLLDETFMYRPRYKVA